MAKLPKEILVYQCDTADDNVPVYAAVRNVNEIPEDVDGEKVGVYVLNTVNSFRVKRELR